MTLTKIQGVAVGSGNFGLTERKDESNIYVPYANAC